MNKSVSHNWESRLYKKPTTIEERYDLRISNKKKSVNILKHDVSESISLFLQLSDENDILSSYPKLICENKIKGVYNLLDSNKEVNINRFLLFLVPYMIKGTTLESCVLPMAYKQLFNNKRFIKQYDSIIDALRVGDNNTRSAQLDTLSSDNIIKFLNEND